MITILKIVGRFAVTFVAGYLAAESLDRFTRNGKKMPRVKFHKPITLEPTQPVVIK